MAHRTTTELTESISISIASMPRSQSVNQPPNPPRNLSGDWHAAKLSLRNPQCCVVAVKGLEHHLSVLQQCFCSRDAPTDLDLRMRVRCQSNHTSLHAAYDDCSDIYNLVMGPSSSAKGVEARRVKKDATPLELSHSCILAREELARGVVSLADGPLDGMCHDVHMRIVCASDYRATDPPFHTDKCPLRGYATLTGPGTEYMDETCLPWEYAALRSLGVDGLCAVSGEGKAKRLKVAEELEFIVMKGDYYDAPLPDGMSTSMIGNVWSRSSACVHRSPPGASSKRVSGGGRGRQRVIISLDLADGMDDQEWYEARRKRGWRSGMTQRKSHLVS
ncbi:hypothetical protein ACHAWF_011602 [Thalassiosira exigua]